MVDWLFSETNRKKVIAIGAAVVAVLIILLIAFSGRSAKSTVKKYIQASLSGEVEKIMKLIPEEALNTALYESKMDEDEAMEYIENKYSQMYDQLNELMDDDWKYSFKIVDEDDASKKELREIQEDYEDNCDLTVKAAKMIEVELTIKFDGNKGTAKMKIPVVKIGSSWYLDITRGVKVIESIDFSDLVKS